MYQRPTTTLVFLGVAAATFASGDTPTYTRDIAPILFETCVRCHRAGQIAPMSLMTYEETRPWAKSIAREVAARAMPPFHASGPLGRFRNDPRLESREIDLIQQWANSDAPRGNPADLPEPPVFNDEGWTLGEPDLVVRFPKIAVEPDDDETFLWYYGDTVFDENVWFWAAELKTGLPRNLHHANVFVTPPDEAIPAGGGEVPKKRQTAVGRLRAMMAWLPGQDPMTFPETSPGRLTQGWGVVIDAHYVPGEETLEDEVRIGFYRATGTVQAFNKQVGLLADDILIPPRTADYRKVYRRAFPEDALVTGFHVHMHYRGKSSRIRLYYPDRRLETILEIPNWDAAWQREYMLTEPLRVPRGTIAEFTAEWDNSADNPNNPDPNAFVREGMESTSEMYNGAIFYRPSQALAEPIRIVDGREVE